MSNLKIFIISMLVLIAGIIITGLVSFLYIQNSIYSSFGHAGQAKEFIVKNGEGVKSISRRLESENLISGAFCFQIYVWRENAESKLQAGEYEIPTGVNMARILEMLANGEVKSDTFWVTIPEGFSSQQISERVSSFQFPVSSFQSIINSPSQSLIDEHWFLKNDKSLEGYLFPDTYQFDKDVTAEEIVKKMLDNFDKKVSPLKSQIEQSNESLYEILTLASIVEKEVSSREDTRVVAGIFLKRLQIGMPLQSDATINYITQKGDPTPSYKDLEAESPYNTYKYQSLPPGPICSPGINAIKAVLNPEKTDYLYFLTPPDKPTVYSKTFKEHEENKRKWLK